MVRSGGLFPAPLPQDSALCQKVTQLFWVLGVFLAKTLQDARLVDLPLSPAFLKLLCGGMVRDSSDIVTRYICYQYPINRYSINQYTQCS